MIKTWQSVLEDSNGHNFSTKTPNWMALFALFLFWPIISKSCITWHALSSHEYLEIHLIFGGKIWNLKFVHYLNIVPLPLAPKQIFEWKWITIRVLFTCIFMQKGENPNLHLHLIFVNSICIGLNLIKAWLVEHI